MILFEKDFLKELVSVQEEPCLSLYQPTHRMHPDNQQDPIRFGNLVKKMEASLSQKFSNENIRKLLEPFRSLADNGDFWNHTLDGLVALRSPKTFHVYGLQRSVREVAIVADSFHTKPLQRYVMTADRYQILGLSLQEVFLYEGNRYVLDKIELPRGVPSTIEEALGSELTDPHLTVATYGGKMADGVNMVHGHGGKKDAALPEHHNLFQKVSRNPFLYLSDVSGKKSGQNDKRCVLEARLNGLDPIAVTHQADTIDFAVDGATDKLQNALDNRLGKLRTY